MRKIRVFIRGIRAAFTDETARTILLGALGIILLAAVAYKFIEGWRFIDALYFTVMTATTVGYGDFTPQTDLGKLFTIVFIFCSMGIVVALITRIANTVLRQSVNELEEAERGVTDEEE